MSIRAKLAVAAILVSALALPLAASQSAGAETCLTAPKGLAPEGSHWFYRLERPALRKCWRLVAKGEERGAAPTTARGKPQRQVQVEPQGDADDEADMAAPVSAAPPALPQTKPAQTQAADNWLTREVSGTSASPLPLPPPAPSADTRAESPSAPAAPAQAAQSANTPPAIIEPPAAKAAAASKAMQAADPGATPLLSLVPTALALFSLLGCAAFYVRRTMQQRADVMHTVQDESLLCVEPSPEQSLAPGEATFAPLPPIAAEARDDDVEEALRRFAENWKRRAA